MITFFSTPKPFVGHIGVIQRNAIESWKRTHPQAEVILFGAEEGAADAARKLDICHIPNVKRNSHGSVFLSSMFDTAQELARHANLCYINCDIILLSDFQRAATRVISTGSSFLMAGRRWDTEITEPLDFSAPHWESQVRSQAADSHHQRPPQWIDYFMFSRGLYYKNIPPFVIGRLAWDNWLFWHARASGARAIDASDVVQAVHQNHDYSHHPAGEAGVWQGAEAQANHALLANGRCFATLENATHRLTPAGLRPNYYHWVVQAKRNTMRARNAAWFALLDVSRPLRQRVGLRRRRVRQAPSTSK